MKFDITRFRRVLAFYAHPDDETLAAGATMARCADAGAEVYVAIPSTGITSRLRPSVSGDEQIAQLHKDTAVAMRILGIDPARVTHGKFFDNEMDRYPRLEVIRWLEDLINKIEPDLLLTHHRYCTNIDHQYCHECAVVATRPGLDRHITVLCGEVPSSTGYLRPVQWEPNLFVEVTEDHLDRKVRAMESYVGEARPDPHPRSREVLKALAKVRGSEAGYHFAEAFMVQRTFG
jgi:LmbE family N-acetylglucosaminyl deacetylase